MDNVEITEGIIVEEEILDKDLTSEALDKANKEKMAEMRAMRSKALPEVLSPKKRKQVNVTKVMNKMGFCPARTLVLLAQNRWEELGLKGPVTAHEVNSATQTLFHATVPGIKPVDYVSQDEVIKQIPVFIEKRGFASNNIQEVIEDDED